MAQLEKQMEILKKGDMSALEQVYLLTKNAVFSVIYSVVRDYGMAEEIMQETYIKLYSNIESYKSGKALGYICTVAKNLAINNYNRRKREVFTDFNETSNLFPSYDISIKDESGVFKAMQQTLDENEYQIVLMHTLGGLKLKEIAKTLQSPEGTVRWQYNNALKKLRNKLKEDEIK